MPAFWYRTTPITFALLPFSWLFRAIVTLRRAAYRAGLLKTHRLSVPVIVVGNITVGGTGKTPLVIWLVNYLREAGYHPGVVSRGYGGHARHWPQIVSADSDPREVGDETVLIARRAHCPVVASPNRVQAAHTLVERFACDVIISDDGLQHYALARDIEIAVIDGERRHGNGYCLPAGPLREPLQRLRSVDLIVTNGTAHAGECAMTLLGDTAHKLVDGNTCVSLDYFRGAPVHALAGIGNPARFFTGLRQRSLTVTEHPFPDHHEFNAGDLRFGDSAPVLMTEKDAVKCRNYAQPHHWYVPVEARVEAGCGQHLLTLLRD